MKWHYVSFPDVVYDITGGNKKIQKKAFLTEGDLPVVDQGQKLVAGYTNKKNVFRGNLPIILFGDHTRTFKYIDFPFALGADGVKALQPIKCLNPKFVYFYCLSLNIPSKGYSRHYSLLKQKEIPIPPLSEQRRIVEIIEQADHLRKMRQEANKRAERILSALFIKMFGDPATNPKGGPVVPISEIVVAPERKNPGQYPDKPFKYIDIAGVNGHTGVITEVKSLVGAEAPSRARQVVVENDVIVSTVRPYLRATAIVPKEYNNQICSTGFCVLRARAGIGFGFLYALTRLQWFTDQLNSRARGASYPAVSDQDILSLRVPVPNDENIMKKFDLCLLDILSLNDKKATSFKKISCLFDIILCRAFSGDLTASWRQAHMKELLQEMEIQAKVLAS